ncbi:hypothetical protein [Acinetobacter kanungonis]|uniref:hypothetical protein n=1 Tax=Acinetobacter kanungonis TaxID=2699469 RepID=UPI0014906857|nr:hypothetical protein [Acinetobacter kanungonis]NCI78941.1 hypothetical protein [Acinetobacter kanungonis]
MNLPLKTFYCLDEAASLLRGLYPQRLDIDDSYFFQLAIKGHIRLGVFKDLDQDKSHIENGTLNFDWYEGTEDQVLLIKHVKSVTYCLSTIEEEGSILILSDGSVRDLYLKGEQAICDTRFDNLFSLTNSEFCIPEEILKDLFFFQYADKLRFHKLYESIFYSDSTNSIYFVFNEDDGNYYVPTEDHEVPDWVCGFWFDRFANSYEDEDKFSDRKIKKEECLIFGEDLQLLIDGKHREPIEFNSRIKGVNTEAVKEQVRLHPKRASSINQIIYGLAKMADLDLSQHQSAYTQLEAFCSGHGIKIPEKDTCGNLFKDAYRKFNT